MGRWRPNKVFRSDGFGRGKPFRAKFFCSFQTQTVWCLCSGKRDSETQNWHPCRNWYQTDRKDVRSYDMQSVYLICGPYGNGRRKSNKIWIFFRKKTSNSSSILKSGHQMIFQNRVFPIVETRPTWPEINLVYYRKLGFIRWLQIPSSTCPLEAAKKWWGRFCQFKGA